MANRPPAFLGEVVYIDTSVLDKITAEMKPKAKQIINKYGVAISGDAAKRAPVDTSALRNSILSESKMVEDLTYRVQDGVTYGVWQEFGNGRMAAQPFLIPAIEAWREKFYSAFAELFK